MVLTEHKIKKGTHDYKPGHGLNIRFSSKKNNRFLIKIKFSEEAWFDSSNKGPLGSDGQDWNKGAGVSFLNLNPFTWLKNRNTAMLAFRPKITPDGEEKKFDLCLYVNNGEGKKYWQILKDDGFKVGIEYQFFLTFVDDQVVLREVYPFGDSYFSATEACLPFTFVKFLSVFVGPWFGGNRTAVKNHSIFCAIEKRD